MSTIIVKHALENVWTSPSEDLQVIFKPAKLTKDFTKGPYFSLVWDNIQTPNNTDYFQYYQIGHLGPTFIGLLDRGNIWTTIADGCALNDLVVDLYSVKGTQLPKTQSWYMIRDQKNILIAIKKYPGFNFNPNTESLFIRFYKNSFFKLSEAINTVPISVTGKTINQNADIVLLQNEYARVKGLEGNCIAYKNGYLVDTFGLVDTVVGDTVEFIHDPSIVDIADYKLTELPIFTSELDTNFKYLVHYSGSTPRGIIYKQDVDFYLINKAIGKGVFFHKNTDTAVRTVTHSDYSVMTSLVDNLVSAQGDWNNPDDIYIRIYVRKSGTNRPLVFEKHQLNELYKLSDDKIISALSGLNATVPFWSAVNLEKSEYSDLMQGGFSDATANYEHVTTPLVTAAYGYHGVAKVIADTPSKPIPNSSPRVFKVPPGMIWNFSAVEYDEDGVMLGVYPATTPNSEYISTNSNAGYVEFLYGLPRNKPDEYYDTDMVIDYGVEFRAYVCGKENGQPNYNWVDVTDSGLYSFINRQFTWLIDKNSYVGMIRTNKHVFHSQVTISPTNGVLSHEIQYSSTINGVTGFRSMSVPMNQIAVYLNGHLLIENLDYVLDFPTIYIVSKEYFTLPASPRLNIIFTGLCNSELKIENNSDVGFVSNGLLSNNNKFDLRDNRILRIAVGGKLKSKDDLLFAEEDAGVTVPHVQNGLPYSITEIVVPVYSETGIETTVLRNEANVIDTAVSDYLTSITPPPVITTPNPVLELHTLYSPFLSKIIFDLKNDVLVDQRILRNYSDPDVVDICKNYTYLLDVDLAKSPSLTDPDFVIIHPHLSNTVISLDIYKYRFVLRVLKVFFNNRLDISGFVNLL